MFYNYCAIKQEVKSYLIMLLVLSEYCDTQGRRWGKRERPDSVSNTNSELRMIKLEPQSLPDACWFLYSCDLFIWKNGGAQGEVLRSWKLSLHLEGLGVCLWGSHLHAMLHLVRAAIYSVDVFLSNCINFSCLTAETWRVWLARGIHNQACTY